MSDRKLFDESQITEEEPEIKPQTTETTLIKSLSILNAKVADFVNWLQGISLLKLTATLSEAALLFALVSYIVTIPQRRQQTISNARNTIYARVGQAYSQGRIDALQSLNEFCASNPGLEAPNAHLTEISLDRCYTFESRLVQLLKPFDPQKIQGMDLSHSNLAGANLSKANLQQVNLQNSNLQGATLVKTNLKGANLQEANLQGANLWGANLQGANLQGANLQGAVLSGAHLQNVDLSEANLVEAKALWSDLQGANLSRVDAKSANFNRADLDRAILYKADLQNSFFKFASLERGARFVGANLQGTNLFGAILESVYQIERAVNWQQAILQPHWEHQIAVDRLPRLNVSLIKPQSDTSIFQAYELGMRRAANRRLEIWSVFSDTGVENEAQTIRNLIERDIDAIVLVPEDPVGSLNAIREAYDAGIVVVTVDFCFDEEIAEQYTFACFNTDSFEMGYDSGEYLVKWAEKHRPDRPLKIGLVDAAAYDRYYPNLEGFLAAMKDSGVAWEEVASSGAILPSEVGQVEEMLRSHPEIDILWGGSNSATQLALRAVENLGLSDRVAVFGIFDLSQENAQRLLDPDNPLQSIVDQSGVFIGYEAVKTVEAILRHERVGYQFFPVTHRLLTQDDRDAVRELLDEANGIQADDRASDFPSGDDESSRLERTIWSSLENMK
ncbi:MAG: pentapeptide repeat-containing protein [Cyanobacteria bacterium SID2]|nr:pentapeptide repeat-containing protein [Cyanobacteria bacterium SID2]MBP0003157.1 pentapeptide repeat-containing protein [Cyanobacteria bacterium SBC]